MSFVVYNKETGAAVMETFNRDILGKINQEKYGWMPVLEWLQQLNSTIKGLSPESDSGIRKTE